MPEIIKNIPKPQDIIENIPPTLLKTKQNFEAARYTYVYDDKEKAYIEYHTLRNQRKDKEILEIVKMYRLLDRDTFKEFVVWYQISKVYDFNNNLIRCPVDERYGLVDKPQTELELNAANQIVDVHLVETQIEYTHEFNADVLKQMIARTRNPHNIATYIGYTRPVKERTNDFIDQKKRIYNQNAWLTGKFEDLITLNEKQNTKETFNMRDIKSIYGSNREQGRTKEIK